MPIFPHRIRQKRSDAIHALCELSEFLSTHDSSPWAWHFREIAITLEIPEDERAVGMYYHALWGEHGSFAEFYTGIADSLPKNLEMEFRSLFSSVCCAMANLRFYLFVELDQPLKTIPRRN